MTVTTLFSQLTTCGWLQLCFVVHKWRSTTSQKNEQLKAAAAKTYKWSHSWHKWNRTHSL